ncbi:MAG: hypothetical protein ABFS18_10790 [Thermodesulfobacteriota bacterium]
MITNKLRQKAFRCCYLRRLFLVFCLLLTNPLDDFAAAEVDSFLRLNLKAHKGEVTAVDISPDGRLVVSGGLDGKVRIWNIADGKELHAFGENLEVADVAFSPNGLRVICAARNDRKKDVIQIWDYTKEKLREEIEGHSQRINTVAYSPNGKMIASGSGDNTVKTWYASNGRDIHSYKAGKNDVLAVSWSPDSDYIASGLSWDSNILVWNTSRDKLVKTLDGHGDWVTAVLYSPSGRNIISGSKDGSIRIWDSGSGKETSMFREAWWGEIRELAISGDGSYLAGATENNSVVIWYVASGKLLNVLAGHSGRVNGVAFSTDGRLIVSGGVDGTVRLWNTTGGADPKALFGLAVKHDKGGERIKADKREAYKWYLKSAEAGYPEAMARVGMMKSSGEGTAENLQDSIKWLTAAADKGVAGAMYSLGNLYASGKGVGSDQDKAASLWAKAADKGHVEAGQKLGKKTSGLDVKTIDKDSLKWVEKAAEAGDVKAMYVLGQVFRGGAKGVEKNRVLSAKWFTAAAKKGHAAAQYDLGRTYATGSGVKQSGKDAFNWYRKAASQGHVKAQYQLGLSYANGAGVKKNHREAAQWIKKAASKGDITAKYRLGLMYCTGKGVKQNYAKAVELWKVTSKKGDAMSTYFLAYMYETGSGLKRNRRKAKELYGLAAKKGNVFAKQALSSLN